MDPDDFLEFFDDTFAGIGSEEEVDAEYAGEDGCEADDDEAAG